MDLSGPGIDVKLKERKKEDKEVPIISCGIVLTKSQASSIETLDVNV